MENRLRYYMDENVPTAVAEQLRLNSIDAISVHDLEQLGDADLNHLQRATNMGRVLCTHDQDFLRLAAEGSEHAGIAFAPQYQATIGGWVRELRSLHARLTANEAVGQVVYLSLK
jgi:hypothetical protein